MKQLSADVERHILCKAINGFPSLPSNTDRENYKLVRKDFLEQSEADAKMIPEKEDHHLFETFLVFSALPYLKIFEMLQ